MDYFIGLVEKFLFFLKAAFYGLFGFFVYSQFIGVEATFNLLNFFDNNIYNPGNAKFGELIVSKWVVWTTIVIAGLEMVGNFLAIKDKKCVDVDDLKQIE